MSVLRESARGRDCEIRIPGVCTGNAETVVLCHLPGGGMGMKQRDMHGAFGCFACHDAVDMRTKTNHPGEMLRLWHHEGVIRTQSIWADEGLLCLNVNGKAKPL